MRSLLALALLVPVVAHAAPITVTLDDTQQNALLSLMDDGVKYGGLAVATNAAVLLQLIQKAQQQAAAPPTPPAPIAVTPQN